MNLYPQRLKDYDMITQDPDGSSPELIEACNQLRWFNIGFIALTVQNNIQVGRCAGSGTLVQIGDRKGILTAAHVSGKLREEVGIVRFPAQQGRLQRVTFDMKHVQVISIGGPNFGPAGPDIAFMALPQDVTGTLSSTGSFFNISKRVDELHSSDFPPNSYVDCLAGVIDERTKPVPGPAAVPGAPIRLFEASFEPGSCRAIVSNSELDLLEFTPQIDDGYVSPQSYAGTSGAALWRVRFERNSQGELKIAECVIHGLAFHETDLIDGARRINCHGPVSVYRHLHDKVQSNIR